MRLIEMHILQSFPVSCLNRDEVGAPKTAIFGGVQRARISSQCLKRAMRLWARQENTLAFRGSRTRKAAEQLAEVLANSPYNWPVDEAKSKAEVVCHLMLNKKAPKKKGKKAPTPRAKQRRAPAPCCTSRRTNCASWRTRWTTRENPGRPTPAN